MDIVIDACEYMIILVLILVIVWMYYENSIKKRVNSNKLDWINQGHPSGKYGNFNPAERLADIIGKYGNPDIIDKTHGGFAIWKKDTLENRGFCWDRVEIRDEQIPHSTPAPHVDFLYCWYKLNIPEELRTDVLSVSESVTYDPLNKMLRVRCHADGPNLATMVICKRVATKEMTLKEAKFAYGPFIFATVKDHKMYNPVAKASYEKELCDFKKTQTWNI